MLHRSESHCDATFTSTPICIKFLCLIKRISTHQNQPDIWCRSSRSIIVFFYRALDYVSAISSRFLVPSKSAILYDKKEGRGIPSLFIHYFFRVKSAAAHSS